MLLAWRIAARQSLAALAPPDWVLLAVLAAFSVRLLAGTLSPAGNSVVLFSVVTWHALHAWRTRAAAQPVVEPEEPLPLRLAPAEQPAAADVWTEELEGLHEGQ